MIDYDKLKLAHELAHKFANKVDGNFVLISQQVDYFGGQEENIMYRSNLIKGGLIACSLDDLIDKLKELTQEEEPKAKYTVGDMVFFINKNKIFEGVVDASGSNGYRVLSQGKQWIYQDDDLYPTKAELIQAQIAYWQKLKQEDCEHDFSTVFYDIDKESYQGCSKCHLPRSGDLTPGEIINPTTKCPKCDQLIFGGYPCPCTMNMPVDSSHVQEKFCTPVNECQHKWDGELISKSPNLGKCKFCGEVCYVALDHDKWLKGECDIMPVKECQHEWQTDPNIKDYYTPRYPHSCAKCGVLWDKKFLECQHESDGLSYELNSDGRRVQWKCKKCGEFYR